MFTNKLIDTSKYEDQSIKHPNKNFPKHAFRWCFIGSSGSGKTNCLINALNELYYDKLHIICPTAKTQAKYKYISDIHTKEDDNIRKQLYKYNKKHKTNYDIEDRVSLHENISKNFIDSLSTDQQNIVIFDDMVCANKKDEQHIIDCFVRGRHKNASFIYLTQSFYKIPRVIRLNCSCFNIFHSVNKSELMQLHKDLGLMSEKKDFVKMVSKLIEPPYSFIHINTDSNVPFRKQNMIDEIKFDK